MESTPGNLTPPFNPERDASAAISFSISCKIPGTEEKMIFGMNCSDASIAVWEPKKGFTQLETSNEGGFVKFTPEIKTWDAQNRNFRTNMFQFRVSNDAKMVGFSDGVTDCFYVDENNKSPGQVKQETMGLMNLVVRNPMFDQEPAEELPATESEAKKLVAQGALENSTPLPGEITTRLLNYSKWKTGENAEKNSKMMAIQEGYANRTLSSEGAIKINFTIGQQISSGLYEILSDKAKKSFTLDETGNYVCTERTETEKLTAMKRETWNSNYAGTHQELGHPASFTDLTEGDRAEAAKVIDKIANPSSIDDYVLVSETKINEKFVFLRKKDSEGRSLELGRKLDDVVVTIAP